MLLEKLAGEARPRERRRRDGLAPADAIAFQVRLAGERVAADVFPSCAGHPAKPEVPRPERPRLVVGLRSLESLVHLECQVELADPLVGIGRERQCVGVAGSKGEDLAAEGDRLGVAMVLQGLPGLGEPGLDVGFLASLLGPAAPRLGAALPFPTEPVELWLKPREALGRLTASEDGLSSSSMSQWRATTSSHASTRSGSISRACSAHARASFG